MILIISPNAAVDYYIDGKNIAFGKTNRVKNTNIVVGGKGINIAKSFKKLTQECKILTFLSGFTGEYIKDYLNQEQINFDYVECKNQTTRINIKLKTNLNETEFNGNGVNLDKDSYYNFLNLINNTIANNQIEHVILAGTNAQYKVNLFKTIAQICNEKQIPFSLDANNKDILELAPLNPFLIKPNLDEFNELFNTNFTATNYSNIKEKIKILQKQGIQNVLLSLGADGAILATKKIFNHSKININNFISTVGAGDTMLSGYIYNYLQTNNHLSSFDFSIMLSSKKITQLEFVNKNQALTFKNKLERIYSDSINK